MFIHVLLVFLKFIAYLVLKMLFIGNPHMSVWNIVQKGIMLIPIINAYPAPLIVQYAPILHYMINQYALNALLDTSSWMASNVWILAQN